MGRHRSREHKVIHAVACPVCRAGRGVRCQGRTEGELAQVAQGRPLVHGARREAWQEWRRRTPVDYYARSTGPVAGILAPQSERARTAALGLVKGAAVVEDGHVRVPDLGAASAALIADGWRVD